MKKREKLANMALIDLLYEINSEMPCFCVVQALGEEDRPCTCNNECYNCISAWLNEEENNELDSNRKN